MSPHARVIGRLSDQRNRDAHVYSADDPDIRTTQQRKQEADERIRQSIMRRYPPEDRAAIVALLVKRGVLLPRA